MLPHCSSTHRRAVILHLLMVVTVLRWMVNLLVKTRICNSIKWRTSSSFALVNPIVDGYNWRDTQTGLEMIRHTSCVHN